MNNFKVLPTAWLIAATSLVWCVKQTIIANDYTENTKTVCVENQEKIRCILNIQKNLDLNKD